MGYWASMLYGIVVKLLLAWGPCSEASKGLACWVEAGLEACFKAGMVRVDCNVLPSLMVGWAVAGRLGWALCAACC